MTSRDVRRRPRQRVESTAPFPVRGPGARTDTTDRHMWRVWIPITLAVAVTASMLTATAMHVWLTPPPVTRDDLAAAIGAYLREHPPEPGADGLPGPVGPQGEPGPGPTPQELDAAIGAHLREHPSALCPRGTRWRDVRWGTAEGKGCVADD